ncbi:hypothetical protein EK904_014480 [Melospiza melodia maxima]|nr:hypothetical protein EK904_014480 [Melospiza melodia maxima]
MPWQQRKLFGLFTPALGWLISPACQTLFLVSVKLPLLLVLDAQLTESSNCCRSATRGIEDSPESLPCLGVLMMWGTGWW